MFYDVGSISNRNIQLLYEYRILREPSENLTAICRDSAPQSITALEWTKSTREIEGFDTVYEATLDVKPETDCVPFLEFHPDKNTDWKWISDYIDVSVEDDSVKLYSTTNHLSTLPIDVYWCYSLRHIDSMLTDILNDSKKLITEYDKLEQEIKDFMNAGGYLRRPEGLPPNLVKIANNGADLVDSLYKITTAEKSRLFVNLTQDNLNHLQSVFNESVEFRFIDRDHYVIANMIAPVMLISGYGDLVLRNIRGQVLVTDWSGTITVIDCPEVHLTATSADQICNLKKLLISRNSAVYLENQIHQIKEVTMEASSLCRHWRANVENISYIGPGCTYWCCAQVYVPGRVQLSSYSKNSNTVFDFSVNDVMGSFIADFDNMMIVGQKNLTPRLGNFDAEPQPSMYVSKWKATYSSHRTGGNGSSDNA